MALAGRPLPGPVQATLGTPPGVVAVTSYGARKGSIGPGQIGYNAVVAERGPKAR